MAFDGSYKHENFMFSKIEILFFFFFNEDLESDAYV